MTGDIAIRPIGVIHTPYHEQSDIPIQGRFKPDVEGCAEIDPEYAQGLKDRDGFSHAFLLYHFHVSDRVTVSGQPFLEKQKHGIFAIRSPHRPNPIGISVVAIQRIEANHLYFTQVDMLDGTPLLDVKPYVTHFDCFTDARCGWIDKHFADGEIPEDATRKRSS